MSGHPPGSGWVMTIALLGLCGCLGSAPRPPCDGGETITTICGFRNPEDLEYVASAGILIATALRFDGPVEDGGYLTGILPASDESGVERSGADKPWTLWPRLGAPADSEPALGDARCTTPPDVEAFYPHGLASTIHDGRVLIYVTAHAGELGGREAVEVFEVNGHGRDTTLAWKACIPTHNAIQANDVTVTADGTVIVSNFQPDASFLHLVKATLLGNPTGNVMEWSRDEGWRVIEETDAAAANGVAVTRDPDMLFYTETLTGLLYRKPLGRRGGAVAVEIGGNPDNLSWTSHGTLLVATHTSTSSLTMCMLGRAPCKSSWEIYEVDPGTMAATLLLSHDGQRLGAVATAVEVGNRLYLSSVFDDRIGVVEVD